MGVSDGTILGATKILDNGADNVRLNMVLIAEGFQAGQQNDFNNLCTDFVNTMTAEPWYAAVGGAINVHRLNVTSTDAGCDDPSGCPDPDGAGDGTVAATYFDSTFCTSGIHRCLAPSWSVVKTALNANFTTWQVGAVIVNTTKRGGCASPGDHIFATGLGAHPGETWQTSPCMNSGTLRSGWPTSTRTIAAIMHRRLSLPSRT
jgi:hypothetical protein